MKSALAQEHIGKRVPGALKMIFATGTLFMPLHFVRSHRQAAWLGAFINQTRMIQQLLLSNWFPFFFFSLKNKKIKLMPHCHLAIK